MKNMLFSVRDENQKYHLSGAALSWCAIFYYKQIIFCFAITYTYCVLIIITKESNFLNHFFVTLSKLYLHLLCPVLYRVKNKVK